MRELNILRLLREKIFKKVVKLVNIESDKNIADIFTKGLSFSHNNLSSEKVGMFDPFQVVT